jgi:predicted CXXCH cytochrome family protein
MKNWTIGLFAAATLAIPAAAMATVVGSLHDFTTTGPAAGYKTTDTGDACKFCHVPHGGGTATNGNLGTMWSRAGSAVATYTWAASTSTAAGTLLPTTMSVSAKRCFSCHDGSVPLNQTTLRGVVTTYTQGSAATTTDISANKIRAGSIYLVNPASMSGEHPVGIPYAGQTYNGVVSAAGAGYVTAIATGCTGGSKFCTTGNTNITLLGGALGQLGVECTSCHDPHGTANTFMLRLPSASLCAGCHTK